MLLRAWQQWLDIVNSSRKHRRRSFSAIPVERLESRCLLAATTGVTIGASKTNVSLTLQSSAGTAPLVIEASGTNLTYQLGSGAVTSFFSSDLDLTQVSKVTISGSSSSNPITINLFASSNFPSTFQVVVNGNGGNDVIDASGCDVSVSLNGGAGRDFLTGGSADDTLNGSSSDDTLIGGDGDDSLNGGAGNDNLSGGAGNDLITGESGDDILMGDEGNDLLLGGAGRDFLDGGLGTDLVRGQGGRDTVASGSYEEYYQEYLDFITLQLSDTWRGPRDNGWSPMTAKLSAADKNDIYE